MNAITPTTTKSKKKTKKRWSKEEKRKHKIQEPVIANQDQQFKTAQRLYQCSRNVSHTHAVISPDNNPSSVKFLTTSNFVSVQDGSSTMYYVKPLLILDLNGILCHRIRIKPQLDDDDDDDGSNSSVTYRDSIDNIATTPIIARPGLSTFLNVVDAHFCLAVWTSAKPQTAKKLLKVLFPDSIREKLLFVWSQSQCIRRGKVDEIIFQKSLKKVFQKYPFWNASNTLLLDDSPEKIFKDDRNNALHPPSLHGKQQSTTNNNAPLSDEQNASLQLEFFNHVAQFFAKPKDYDDAAPFHTFLRDQGSTHMGWRGNC